MMKKGPFPQIAIIAIFAFTVIGISTSVAAGRKRPHVTRDNNVMILEYDFEEPDIITKGDIDFVTINGFERYSKAGAPVIPVKPVEILIPSGMKIAEIMSIAVNTDQLPDTYRLPHGKKPFRRTEGKPETPSKPDPRFFEMKDFWPGKYHNLLTVQSNRGYHIAYINLFPLQYSPKAGRIRMTTKLRLTVRFAGMDSRHRVKPTINLKKKLERKIDNPATMISYDAYSTEDPLIPRKGAGNAPLTDPAGTYYGENYKYIVITSNSLATISDPYSFQALCDSKIARGISAGIVTTEWIYANYTGTDNADRIRSFLIDAYNTWETEYALLGGDKDIIPVRLFYDGNYDIPADLYYGCVDPPDSFDGDGDGKYGESNDGPGGGEVDLTAEIFTGRAAVENATEVVNFVNKTLVYQTTDDPYLNEAGTMGSYLGFGGIQEFTGPFSELMRLGSSLYLGHHTYGFEDANIPNARNFNVVTLYDEHWWNDNKTPYYDSNTAGPGDGVPWNWNTMGWDATTDLVPYLNGAGGHTTPHLLYISDHGAWNWGMVKMKTTPTNDFNCDHLGNVHNTRPFFFYDDSCEVGAFDHADCFGEVITTMEHGAFACILNSRDGLGAAGNTLDSPSTQMTREFFHSVLGKGIFELGRAHQDAKESCIWRLGSIAWLRYVYYEVSLFGDPELRLRVTTDDTPPTPSTMTFATLPHATGETSIAMVATTAIDSDGSGVEYYFECTAGSGNDSGWQDSTTYTDIGLAQSTPYTYRVRARDKSPDQNASGWSATASATTASPCPTCGDLDRAGVKVDLVDYGLFANCWGENPLTNSSCACANLVEYDKHIIDLLDLSVLTELYLSSSESYAPNCSTSMTDPYAPTPDQMTFATAPYPTGASSIAMVATTATDISGVEYYFTCTAGGGHDSLWQASPSYTDTGLTPDTLYTYTVMARDKSVNQNATAPSAPLSATTTPPDTCAPSPDPMTFSSVPAATGDSSIAMTASTATDITGVEYYFTCTAGGGNDSGWQDSRTYEDTGLTPETQYTYTVTARDKSANHNPTAASSGASATTNTQDTVSPTPDPMTWATYPNARSSISISMRATTASDSSGVEYFFDCNTAGGHDSGWQDSASYTDNGLTPETSYTYTVMARDKTTNPNLTAPSPPLSATTLPVPVGPSVWTDKAVYEPGEDIVVHFANAGGNNDDWVGFYDDGDSNRNYLDYIYLEGDVSGTVTYGGLPNAGDYNVRLFFNDSYTLEASNDLTVE